MRMRVSLAFFFSCALEGEGEKKPKKFEQVQGRAHRKCGGSTALFFFFFGVFEPGTGALWRVDRTFPFFGWSEPRAGARPSLQKMWRVDRAFFLGCLNLFFLFFTLFHSFLPLFISFSLFFPFFYFFFHLFTSFLPLFTFFFLPFFTSFFPFTTFFTLFPLFFPFFPFFFAFFFAFSLAWPRPQPCRLTLPSLALPHITSPLLSFLNTFFYKKKKHRDFQQISVLSKKFLPPKRLIISRSIHMSSCRRWIQIVIPNASCL